MRRAFLFVLATCTSGAAEPPTALMGRVQAAYQGAQFMQARFTQTYTDSLRHRARVESGALWARQDGRVRWSYEVPERKEFVFDGSSAYFYEPLNAQVTVFERFADSPVAQASQFLWGRGEIRERFALAPCRSQCPALAAQEVAIVATPKAAMPMLDHVLLVVDAAALRVRRALLFDPLGNRTEYAFTDVRLGAAVPASTFAFKVPQGVSLLRATAEGAAPPAETGPPPADDTGLRVPVMP